MAIRTRTSDGYQQVELTSELLHSQSGATQQVISTVPCRKHLPFFFTIFLADVFIFGSVFLFAIYATQFGDGFSFERMPDFPSRQFNLHALIMLTAFIYLNGQAITVYKSNYLVKHKSINMLYHFVLHLLTILALLAGLYMAYEAQEVSQRDLPQVSHFYSLHSWCAIVTILLFSIQFLAGFFGFFVTLCCRKLTARLRSKASPAHRMLTLIVLSVSVATALTGLLQLARFQLNGSLGKEQYRDLGWPAVLINLSGLSVLASLGLIFVISCLFKRRQAHDLPVLFKIILLVSQFVQFVLILVVLEFIFQLITPHVHRAINSQIVGNTTIHQIYNATSHSISEFVNQAKQLATGATSSIGSSNQNASLSETTPGSSNILLGIVNTTTTASSSIS